MYGKLKTKNYPLYEVRPVKDLRALIDDTAELFGDKLAFRYRDKGVAGQISYKDFKYSVDSFGTALCSLGLDGKHIAIIGENSFKWALSFLTTLNLNGIVVPVDKELSPDEIAYILNKGDVDAIIYAGGKTAKKIAEARTSCGRITHYICMDSADAGDDLKLDELLKKGGELLDNGDRTFVSITDRDITKTKEIMFTSGTTGRPKGVMITEEALIVNIISSQRIMHITDCCLSVLPYHHAYESTTGILTMLHNGMTICINDSLRNLMSDFELYKPTEMQIVPLFAEKMYRRVWDTAEEQGKAKKLRFALKLSRFLLALGIDMREKLFADVRKAFGGRLNIFISGGAPLKKEIAEFFYGIGIILINGYGITECAPLISINRPEFANFESVGVVVPGLELRVDKPNENGEGEFCVRGKNVFKGYYKDEDATSSAIIDGWFHTGDIGRVDANGFLHITGRIKNLIILKNGENVSPEELEEKLMFATELISEVVVSAMTDDESGEKVLGAEIFPMLERAEKLGVTDAEAAIRKVVTDYNASAAAHKRIKKIVFRSTEFEKTSSKKIKRKYDK